MTLQPALTLKWLTGLLLLGACSAPSGTLNPGPGPALAVPALSIDPEASISSPVLEQLPAAEPEQRAVLPLGWAAGRPFSAEELLTEWHATDPASLWLVLEKLVTARLAEAEAERMGLQLAPEAVALRLDSEQDRLREVLAQENKSLAAYARQEYGQSPELFMRALGTAVKRQMLIERVTRAWVLSNPWLRLRMIVVGDDEAMGVLRARLDAGEDFASLAIELSQDGSAPRGGLVPFLVREEESPLSRRAFSQAVGELGEPFLHKGLQVLVRVEQRREARSRTDWHSLGADVEASLLKFPITDAEFGHWKLRMEKRYPIDVARFLELLNVESSD